MRLRTMAALVAALVGCSREHSSVAGDWAATSKSEVTTGIATSPPATPMRVMPMSAQNAVVGGVAGKIESADAVDESSQTGGVPDVLQNVSGSSVMPTMVIRTGQAFIEVDKVDPAILKIRQLAAQVGGYITNSSLSGGRDQIRQATFEIKIPGAKYDEAVTSLTGIGKVETVNSTAQDVGEEFVDVTARVTNARRLEERLIDLLAKRTGKLEEVLRVERELARVREEIERYEGRLRYLNSRVAMSTLVINVHEPAPVIGNAPGENPIEAAVRRAWKNFVALIAALIASLGVLIPLGLVGLAGWGWYRRWKNAHSLGGQQHLDPVRL